MCSTPDIPEMPDPVKPDPIVKSGDDDGSNRAAAKGNQSKIAALYGAKSMNKTGGLGLSGAVSTAGKTAFGA